MIAVAVAAAFITWLVVGRNHNNSTASTTVTRSNGTTGAAGRSVGPVAVSPSGLATLAKTLKVPIYWAGPKPGFTYELTVTQSGKEYVRYLPAGVKVGDPRANFLIVATYPFPKGYKALMGVAKGREQPVPGGGIAFVDPTYPKSVHMAFRGAPYQIEVYDPHPQQSRQVALSGTVKSAG